MMQVKWWLVLWVGLVALLLAPPARGAELPVDSRFTVGDVLEQDDFSHGADRWVGECEKEGTFTVKDGVLDIDAAAGATVWFKTLIAGPVMIEYEATAVSAGGVNDRVSDLNCFWMARDSRSLDDLFATHRSGKFEDYNRLVTYYVGLGGNGNTTTRFRRYVGDEKDRPLLAKNDLRDKGDLLVGNQSQLIQLIACGNLVEYFRDGRRVFEMDDPQPYTSGWFGFRTPKSHLQFKSFKVYRVEAKAAVTQPVK